MAQTDLSFLNGYLPESGFWSGNTVNIPGLPSAHIGTDQLPVPSWGNVRPVAGLAPQSMVPSGSGDPSNPFGGARINNGFDDYTPFSGGTSKGVAGGIGDAQFALNSFSGTPRVGDGTGFFGGGAGGIQPAQGTSGFNASSLLPYAVGALSPFIPGLGTASALYDIGSGIYGGYQDATTVPYNQRIGTQLNLPNIDGSEYQTTLDATPPVIGKPDPSILSQVFNFKNTLGNYLGQGLGDMFGTMQPSEPLSVADPGIQPTPLTQADFSSMAAPPSVDFNRWMSDPDYRAMLGNSIYTPRADTPYQLTAADLAQMGATPSLPGSNPFSLTGDMMFSPNGASFGGAGFGYGFTGLGSEGNGFNNSIRSALGGDDWRFSNGGWAGGDMPPGITT